MPELSPEDIAAALEEFQRRNQSQAPESRTQGGDRPMARRTRWTGPMRDRPVVDGKAVVTAEELTDFRRQFGAEKTLRDLLNADRGIMPSAADMRARGMQGGSYAPGVPGQIPSNAMAGPPMTGRIPGEVERNVMNALTALGPMVGPAMGAMSGRMAPMARDWRARPPAGADAAKWNEIVRRIDQAYPQNALRP